MQSLDWASGAVWLRFWVRGRTLAFEGGEQQPPDTERDLNRADGGISIAPDKGRDPNGDPGHAECHTPDAYPAGSHGAEREPDPASGVVATASDQLLRAAKITQRRGGAMRFQGQRSFKLASSSGSSAGCSGYWELGPACLQLQ
jgi:hypothetical protein